MADIGSDGGTMTVTYNRRCPHQPFDLCYGCLTSERDALAAQVAAWVGWACHDDHCDCDCYCGLTELRANIPAAAARYLAADRVAQAMVWPCGTDTTYGGKVVAALAYWRKAAGHG